MQFVEHFWINFINDISTKFSLAQGESKGMLTRLKRTGCIESDSLDGYVGGNSDGYCLLTPIYYKLKELTQLKLSDLEVSDDTK